MAENEVAAGANGGASENAVRAARPNASEDNTSALERKKTPTATAPILRPFQETCVDQIESKIAEGERSLIIVAPTGSGKTVIASEYIRHEVARYQRVLVLAHRREIVAQTSSKLDANGVYHGTILAGVTVAGSETSST